MCLNTDLQKISISDIFEHMNTIKLQQRGVLTLPKKIREVLNLSEGMVLNVTQEDNKIILERSKSADTDLLMDIKNSLSDIKAGKFIEFGSVSEFKKKLNTYHAN